MASSEGGVPGNPRGGADGRVPRGWRTISPSICRSRGGWTSSRTRLSAFTRGASTRFSDWSRGERQWREQRIGIVMNGVTGRMGMNQHLDPQHRGHPKADGGLLLKSGDTVDARPYPCRPQRGQAGGRCAQSARDHPLHHRSRRGPRRSAPTSCSSTPRPPRLAPACCGAPSRPENTSIARKPTADNLADAVEVAKLAELRPGSSMAWCRTSCSSPACASSRWSSTADFWVASSACAASFGYWVFEGDWQEAQRPIVELQEGGGRRHHPRYALPLALRARQRLRAGSGGVVPRCHAYPHPRR